MTRTAVLRAGYAALGLAFAAIAGTFFVGSLLFAGFLLALVAGFLLAFSDDDLPKWAGIVLVAYFALSALAFLAATPVTINYRGERWFANRAPPELVDEIAYWMGLVSPLLLGATAILSAWERERAPRLLLYGAVGGFLLVAVLSVALEPRGVDATSAARSAQAQGTMLRNLFVVSAAAGATGMLWAAARPDSDPL